MKETMISFAASALSRPPSSEGRVVLIHASRLLRIFDAETFL
jgi:hypothetical protein